MNKTVFRTTAKKPESPVAQFASGEVIFSEGDAGAEMFILQSGRVEILKLIGGEERRLAVLEKGDFFGEMSLLEELPRAASARALTSAKLLEINGSTFDRMLRHNPEIAVRMMRKLSRRLRQTDELLQKALGTTETEASAGFPLADRERALGIEVLVHEKSGMEFRLSASSETTIGRKDPVTGIYPDVDLTPLDNQRSISRRHAKIYRRGERFFLAEDIGTMNGTFLNGDRLETGVPSQVRDGDAVRIGMVELRMRVGS
jgi:CRP-like cAMP-binding protein